MTPNGLVPVAEYDTRDGVYDCAWSEVSQFSADAFLVDLLPMLCLQGLSLLHVSPCDMEAQSVSKEG